MSDLVHYNCSDNIATITMDDGKANVMNREMIAALNKAFDQAAHDKAVVVLTGRDGIFSGGYDMTMFESPLEEIFATMRAGGEIVHRIFSHPFPVVGACNGHAIAQGAFTLLACDLRIGAGGPYKIGLNEVAIGLTIPHYGIEIARHQLAAPWFDHSTVTGSLFKPDIAQQAGFLHDVADPNNLAAVAAEHAARFVSLDMNAHSGTKSRTRSGALKAILAGLDEFTAEQLAQPQP